jgi:amidase
VAAAVASGTVDMAIGTDTGGSVRLPAACCGIVGFKAGYGVISRQGVHPSASSLDCVGVLARDVAVVIRAMQALVPGFAISGAPRKGRLVRLSPPVDPSVAEAFDRALAMACRWPSGKACCPIWKPPSRPVWSSWGQKTGPRWAPMPIIRAWARMSAPA